MLSLLLSLLRTIGKSLVYGSVFVLITGAFFTYAAWPNDGLFGQYFHNIITDATSCGTNTAITGFDTTSGIGTYGVQECTTFQNIVQSVLGSTTAPVGQAVTGFDTNGNPQYGNVGQWTGTPPNNIYYTGANVGIGTSNPMYKLDVNGDILARNNMAAQIFYDGNDGTYYVNPNGNTVIRTLTASGGNIYAPNFFYTSDERKKENITTILGALDIIESLRGVRFHWKENKKADIGFIAQEVEKVLPELVHTDTDGLKSIEYGNITAILVEGFHTLSDRIATQEREIAQLRHEIELLKNNK